MESRVLALVAVIAILGLVIGATAGYTFSSQRTSTLTDTQIVTTTLVSTVTQTTSATSCPRLDCSGLIDRTFAFSNILPNFTLGSYSFRVSFQVPNSTGNNGTTTVFLGQYATFYVSNSSSTESVMFSWSPNVNMDKTVPDPGEVRIFAGGVVMDCFANSTGSYVTITVMPATTNNSITSENSSTPENFSSIMILSCNTKYVTTNGSTSIRSAATLPVSLNFALKPSRAVKLNGCLFAESNIFTPTNCAVLCGNGTGYIESVSYDLRLNISVSESGNIPNEKGYSATLSTPNGMPGNLTSIFQGLSTNVYVNGQKLSYNATGPCLSYNQYTTLTELSCITPDSSSITFDLPQTPLQASRSPYGFFINIKFNRNIGSVNPNPPDSKP